MAKEELYTLEEFKPYIRKLFNVEPMVFDALCTTLNKDKKYSKNDIAKAIKSWLSKEAK